MPSIDLSVLKKYTILFVLLGLMVLFSLVSPYFLTVRNLTNIVTQNTYFIIVAVGLSFVMIGGGIDLSVGYQMSLVGVVTAMLMVEFKQPVWLAIAVGLLLGTGLGLINGLIVTRIRIFPLIATLATSVIFQGISYMVSQAKTFRGYPEEFLQITRGKVLGLPFDILLTLVVILAASLVYSQMIFGLRLMALGGNEEASRRAGINTRGMKVSIYAICGFLTAVATMVMISKANTTHASFGPGTEFTALTAAIVGGVSFMGGEGSVPALVGGVFVLAVLGNGMQLAGWGTYPQYIVRGMILLGAVAFDEYQKSARMRLKSAPRRDEDKDRLPHTILHTGKESR
ncbi:MAG: ABC transporter permease [Anaerolineae bacterium]|nr:ABC transporter permease [Anaerolineae bacterium]